VARAEALQACGPPSSGQDLLSEGEHLEVLGPAKEPIGREARAAGATAEVAAAPLHLSSRAADTSRFPPRGRGYRRPRRMSEADPISAPANGPTR